MSSVCRRLVFTVVAASALGAGCASVKSLPTGRSDTEGIRIRAPASIQVQPFETSGGMWQRGADTPAMRTQIRDWLTGSLLRHLSSLAPTHLRDGEATAPTSGWLVTGRFLRVNPGSRMQRLFLGGVGAGASKLETRVDVFDLAVSTTEPVLSFSTTGGSNLVGGLPGALSATDDDIERTAREIHDYLNARLWPVESELGRPAGPGAIDPVEIAPAPRGRR